MGSRYFVTVAHCGEEFEAYYAPTSGFWFAKCPKCRTAINLEQYTGIPAESTANTQAGLEGIALDREAGSAPLSATPDAEGVAQ